MTGPEAIAEELARGTVTLRRLDLSWNFIRNDSAKALACVVAGLNCLTELRLAHNCFGNEPAQYLAAALHDNSTLQVLDLSYNAVEPAPALVMACALRVNTSLVLLKLDGNPIGKRGARALVSALSLRGSDQESSSHAKRTYHPLDISLRQCETTRDDCGGFFDPAQAGGSYRLNVSHPYDRMVAMELLHMATHRDNCGFQKLLFYPPGSKLPSPQPGTKAASSLSDLPKGPVVGKRNIAAVRAIKLHRATQANDVHPPNTSLELPRPRGPAPQWTMVIARAMANHAVKSDDVDSILSWMGLSLDDEHLNALLQELKQLVDTLESNRAHLAKGNFLCLFWRAIFSVAVPDSSDCINKQELKRVLAVLGVEAPTSIVGRLISEYDADNSGVIEADEFVALAINVFARERQAFKTPLCEHENVPWRVPRSGHLDISFDFQPSTPSTNQCSSDEGAGGLINLLQSTASEQERARIFEFATAQSELYLTREQAHSLLEAARTGQSIIVKLARVLPQIAAPEDCAAVVETHVSGHDKMELMRRLGQAWGPLLGQATGHYCLEMRHANDRLAARKLAGLANAQRLASQRSGHSDTSQHGNWQNFRNERWQSRPLKLAPAWLAKLDDTSTCGTLQFDYVSTDRPKSSARPISKRRLDLLLEMMGLSVANPGVRRSDDDIENEDIDGDPYAKPTSDKECDPVALHWREMTSTSRQFITPSFYSEAYELAQKTDGDPLKAALVLANEAAQQENDVDGEQRPSSPPSKSAKKEKLSKRKAKKKGKSDRPPTPQQGARLIRHLPSPPTNPPAGYRDGIHSLGVLKANIGHSYFTADQALQLVSKLPAIAALRVEAVLTIFDRLLDLHNLCKVLDALTEEEHKECVHRLGPLNVYSPMDVDRVYSMNLKVYDERHMAAALVTLAVAEPGENWIDEKFKRKESMPWLPGWELPKEWEDDIADYGILEARYSSTGPGCKPALELRRGLVSNFLCGRGNFGC